jgi:hypothetical protein
MVIRSLFSIGSEKCRRSWVYAREKEAIDSLSYHNFSLAIVLMRWILVSERSFEALRRSVGIPIFAW